MKKQVAAETPWRNRPRLKRRESSRWLFGRDDSRSDKPGGLRHNSPLQFLFWAAPLLLAAQEPTRITVEGRVLDSITHQPLSGVAVILGGTADSSGGVESDAEGRFRFEGLEPGTYRATAQRSGYERKTGQVFEVAGKDGKQEISIGLDRFNVLAGRVLDHEGRPVVSAKVTAYRKDLDYHSAQPYWLNVDTRGAYGFTFYRGQTDEQGEYRYWALPKGEYVILVKPNPTPGPRWRLRLDATPMFYPASPTLDEAGRIELGWGEVREGMDIRLGPPAPTKQTGIVVAGGESCGRCGFAIFRKGQEGDLRVADGATSPKGEVTLEGFPPGEYVIGGSARARAGPHPVGSTDFVVMQDGERPFLLTLADPVTLRGRVIFEDAPEEIQSPPNNTPLPQFNFARLMVRVRDWEKIFYGCQSDSAEFYGEGAKRFFEATASPGHCRLTTVGPPDSYVAAMELDGRPLESPELVIPPAGLSEELAIRIRFDLGEVVGRVDDADARAWVHLFPKGGNGFANRRSAQVDADGSFRVKAPPGRWAVQVARSPRPEALPSGARLQTIEVRAGQTSALTYPLSSID